MRFAVVKKNDDALPRDAQLGAYPAYAAAASKLEAVTAKLREREAEVRSTERQIYDLLTGGAGHKMDLDRRAAALLAGEEGIERRVGLEALRTRLGDLSDEISVLGRAVALQRDIVAQIRGDISVAVARQFVPDHHAAIRKIVAALEALEAAHAEELAARVALDRTGCVQLLPAMTVQVDVQFRQRAAAYLASSP
jgi:hypothetical protein